ncbi:hypothetical protein DSO57_1026464 [Entomophthora muscae]|uniref:Uncharacterized protein n=1 Tax=Entomophthora muscae TaxID=34485 RepID=A0ACC2U130_9FUNG|nr:hypothetical protein DSO57_1026464 [Entomophthora muscae]
MLLSVSPDPWHQLFLSKIAVQEGPLSLLYVPDYLPGRALDVLLTVPDNDGSPFDQDLSALLAPTLLPPLLVPSSRDFPAEHLPLLIVLSPSCTPWLLASMLVMAVNIYLPPLSPDLSL